MLFSPLNSAILLAYLGGMLLIGLYLARRQETTEEFFLAGRSMPWLVVAMSMYASLTSAVTYMALPATSYSSNISMIVVAVVSPLLVPFLILLFYPFYHKLQVTTSYEYIGKRFGRVAQCTTSSLFILARLGWLGTVIYAPAMALSVVTGMSMWSTILLMGAVATIYTVMGGATADIWSDTIQFVIMIVGAVWVATTLALNVPGGISGILAVASDSGRLSAFDWHLSLTEMSGFVVAVSFFLSLMQEYGTDQTTVQRLMATPTLRGMSKAIMFNAVVDSIIVSLLLFIGLGMLAFYKHNPALLPAQMASDHLLPYYIIHALPNGVSGLLITAIFAAAMSSMDSGIGSLATVVVNDFVDPLRVRRGRPKSDVAVARVLTLVFGVAATATAFYISSFDSIIKAFTSVMSLFSAPILSLFLLGMLTRRGSFAGWLVGIAVSMPLTWWIQHYSATHWAYFFPFSFGVSISVGYVMSLLIGTRPPARGLTVWDR